tara:strand:+ start:1315 stop:1479 length:165 start_codon:yes stop_codon:yes gene_type:complete
VQHAIPVQETFEQFGTTPNRGKGGYNWVAGSDALPMLGWKVEECHKLVTIFLQR